MAFATSTFLGTTRLRTTSAHPKHVSTRPICAQPSANSNDIANSTSGLKNWVTPEPVSDTPPRAPLTVEGRSKIFSAFMATKTAPYPGTPGGAPRKDFGRTQNALNAASSPFFRIAAVEAMRGYGKGGDAREVVQPTRFTRRVDDYIADCARRQYIAKQNSSGVYSQSCTEGNVRGAAEESRVAALAARFRRRQRSSAASFADLFETRRRATALANGCNYEESLVRQYADAALATVVGSSEAIGACARYAAPESVAERYMADCVARAASARATRFGVYNVMCCDGTTKGAAEAKRVSTLATQYRQKQKSKVAKEGQKYEVAKYGMNNYGNMCSYENGLFKAYPAAAATMRPDFARY